MTSREEEEEEVYYVKVHCQYPAQVLGFSGGAGGHTASLTGDAKSEHTALRDAVFLRDRLPWYDSLTMRLPVRCQFLPLLLGLVVQ